MKFETIVKIRMNQDELAVWRFLYQAISDLAHKSCEDVGTAEAVNDFYEAMQYFAHYLED